jgi:protein-export membrane protein SecD
MKSLSRFLASVSNFPNKMLLGLFRFIWPKDKRRRYRTIIIAVFFVAFLAGNLDYPKYWNSFAEWANPKLDAIDMPEFVRKQDKWYALKKADDILNVPKFFNVPFSLGLDLQGGIHLIYRADLSQVKPDNYNEAMGGLRDVIERRVNLFGVREPQVLIQERDGDYRLVVELAGIRDFNKAIELIGTTPYLEFKEEISSGESVGILRNIFTSKESVTDEQLAQACVNLNPELIRVVIDSQGVDPCFKSVAPLPLTGQYLENASMQFDPNTNQPLVLLELNEEGAVIFQELTARNISKRIAIYLDGVPINWPVVQQEIPGGNAQISGFNIEEAKILSRNLNAGALPVPISLVSQQSIGASLGEESLSKSLRAGVAGVIAIVLFMILIYRVSGVFGVLALMIYIVLLLAIFKIIPVTLTLPGIAGLILSIGMAVDANILVFERLREEIAGAKGGKVDFLLVLNHAYARAWTSIRDGNVSTLITCAILFWFSTSFIKGFALTLGIGVSASMFSAMIVTKYFMRLAGEGRLGKKLKIWVR